VYKQSGPGKVDVANDVKVPPNLQAVDFLDRGLRLRAAAAGSAEGIFPSGENRVGDCPRRPFAAVLGLETFGVDVFGVEALAAAAFGATTGEEGGLCFFSTADFIKRDGDSLLPVEEPRGLDGAMELDAAAMGEDVAAALTGVEDVFL